MVRSRIAFPRTFSGPNLKMIAFPAGRNRHRHDFAGWPGAVARLGDLQPAGQGKYAGLLFSRHLGAGGRKEAGGSGPGSAHRAALRRAERAGVEQRAGPAAPCFRPFTGAYPFARLEFEDKKLPILVSLEAFNPLVPLDVEASGLPIAVLRYQLKNPANAAVKVGIAFSLENPVGKEGRQANFRRAEGVAGLFMDNPFLPATDPLKGSMFLGVLGAPEAERFVPARVEAHAVVGWAADLLGRLHG